MERGRAREVAKLFMHAAEAAELVGRPAFDVRLGRKEQTALSFEELRKKVLDVAREGVGVQRFKGLGEMNADQLYDTTMDAGRRTLQQVTICLLYTSPSPRDRS